MPIDPFHWARDFLTTTPFFCLPICQLGVQHRVFPVPVPNGDLVGYHILVKSIVPYCIYIDTEMASKPPALCTGLGVLLFSDCRHGGTRRDDET